MGILLELHLAICQQEQLNYLRTNSKLNDIYYPLDEVYRLIQLYEPREILIFSNNYETLTKEKLYLN